MLGHRKNRIRDLLTWINVCNLSPHDAFKSHRIALCANEELYEVDHVKGIREINFRFNGVSQAIVTRIAYYADNGCPLITAVYSKRGRRTIQQVRNAH